MRANALPGSCLRIGTVIALVALAASCDDGTSPGRSAAQIVVPAGANQVGPVGAELPDPILIRVLDVAARPVAGEDVEFEVLSGGGSLDADAGETDADGAAEVRWTLGNEAGSEQRLEVRLRGREDWPATIVTATAVADAPAELTVSGSGQEAAAGTPLPDSVRVQIRDRFGNAVPGQQVAWSVATGGGSVSFGTSTSGAAGVASAAWVLGPVPGEQRLTVTVGAVTGGFVATAVPGSVASIEVSPDSIALGMGTDTVYRAIARDEFGNTVAGASIRWSVSDDAIATIDAAGRATGVAMGVVEVIAQSGNATGSARLSVDSRFEEWDRVGRAEAAFYGVGGIEGGPVYVVGAEGLVARVDGSAVDPAPAATNADLYGVWGPGPGQLFAAGANGTIVRLQAGAWSVQGSGTMATLRAVHGSSPAHAIAVGDGGTIVRFDGTTWSTELSGTTTDLHDVWSVSASESYAVGDGGLILRSTGSGWTAMASGTTEDLLDVSGTPEGMVAIGEDGTVLRLNGSWAPVGSPAPSGFGAFVDAWAASPTAAYAVNDEVTGSLAGIYFFDGTGWAHVHTEGAATPFSDWRLVAVWGSSPDGVSVAGYRDLGPAAVLLQGIR